MAEAAPNTGKVSANEQDYDYSVTVGTDGDNKDQPQSITINGEEYKVTKTNGVISYTNSSGAAVSDPAVKGVLDKSLADWQKKHPQQPAPPKVPDGVKSEGEDHTLENGKVVPDTLIVTKDGITYTQKFKPDGTKDGDVTAKDAQGNDVTLDTDEKKQKANSAVDAGLDQYKDNAKNVAAQEAEVTQASALQNTGFNYKPQRGHRPNFNELKGFAADGTGSDAAKDVSLKNFNEKEQAILKKAGQADASAGDIAAAQLVLEDHHLSTGRKNHGHKQDLDGIRGAQTTKVLKELGVEVQGGAQNSRPRPNAAPAP